MALVEATGPSLLLEMRSRVPNLSAAEQRIAEYVIEHADQVPYLSITQFALQCDVGEGTVVRFCQSLGLKGFTALKLALASELARRKVSTPRDQAAEDEPISVQIAHRHRAAIEETAALLDMEAVARAAAWIRQARHIELFGVGASAVVAADIQQRFLRLGVTARLIGDTHLQAMAAAALTPSDVGLAISHSGSTSETVYALELAKKAGAHTIAITNHRLSPVTEYAEVVLLTSAPETPLVSGAVRSLVAQLYIIDVLTTVLVEQMGEEARAAVERSARAIAERLV